MKSRTPTLPALITLLVCLFGAGVAAAQTSHKNDEAGYSIRLPKHYEPKEGGFFGGMPTNTKYCLDFFQRKVGLPTTSLFSYDLEMAAYFFPSRASEASATGDGAEREEEKSEGEKIGEALRVGNQGQRNYRSFREFAQESIKGFFFEKEKETKIAGFEAVLYEMKFEKLTSVEQRWAACSYAVPGGEFAVVFNCTAKDFKKWNRTFGSTFKSLKITAENSVKLTRKNDASVKVIDNGDPDKEEDDASLRPEERRRRGIARREARFTKEIDELEAGWKHIRSQHFLILTHMDSKYSKTVEKHVEKLREWLDANFGEIGQGEVEDAIIRLYKSAADAGHASGGSITVIVGGGAIDEFEHWPGDAFSGEVKFNSLNGDIVRHYFAQKNSELWNRLPRWLRYGLQEYTGDAVLKGSKVQFAQDSWERRDLAMGLSLQDKHRKERSTDAPPLLQVQDIFRLSSDEQAQSSTGRHVNAQNASLLRFLIEGPGESWKRTEGLLNLYLSQLLAQIVAVEKRLEEERKESSGKDPSQMTEEDLLEAEDEEYKKRRTQTFDTIEREIQQKAFENVFADWTQEHWDDFHKRWLSYAKKSIR